MLVINGVKIADASGGGDVLLKTDEMDDFQWVESSFASVIIGDEYFSNKELRDMVDDDYHRAVTQCLNL